MRLNVSAWAIRNPIPPIVLFIVLTVLGLFSFASLPITRFPNIDFPLISVTVTQSGAAPAELQNQVTKKVEDAVAGVNGVKHITSTISEGTSSTSIEFQMEINSDRALNDVKDAISKIRADLPRSIDEPIVQRFDIAGLPIATYAAYAPAMTTEELSWFVDDVIARNLQSVSGVSQIRRIGGADREIRVTLRPDRLLSLGVTAAEINQQLRMTSVDLTGGRGELGGQEQSIRTLGGAQTLQTLAATSIVLSGDRKVRLDELATISDTSQEPRIFATYNGDPVVAFSISRASGTSDAVVAEAVSRKIAELGKKHPEARLELIDTEVTYTVGNYQSAMHTLLEGAFLAVIVVFLFLRDWRATVIAAIALPLSILPTFWVISLLGYSLNLVSLLGITLVTGILVDDAIVEIENIVRHMRMGKSPYRASLEAADEIGLAVIAITLTIVAVFAPVSFMKGIAGQYFKQFGITVAVAVLFSLLVARLITPLMTAYFLRAHEAVEEKDGTVLSFYTKLVDWSVRHKYRTLAIGFGFFVLSIMSTGLLPSAFMPEEDINRSVFVAELPPGARLVDTRRVTNEITRQLREMPEVKSVIVSGGAKMPQGADIRMATLFVNYVPKGERSLRQKQLESKITKIVSDIPDVRFYALNDGGQRAFSLTVAGSNESDVIATANAMQREMKTIPILESVYSTVPLDRPEIRLRPRAGIAAELGVSTDVIAETIRVATIGDVEANLAKFSADDRQIPIRVQLPDRARSDIVLLQTLKVPTAYGAVPLSTIAEFELGRGPSSIDRYDRALRIALEADLKGTDALGEAVAAVMELPAVKNRPAGVEIRQFGDIEVMTEVFTGFAQAMGIGLMLVLGVLILLFSNFLQPFTILLSLPLCIGGVILALLMTNNSISMPVVIGILMLMGIVTKNAIMLVDFAMERVAQGWDHIDAIVDAGRKRARPIVMTTLAMVAGMVPSALAFGSGGEFRAPMAIAVIGGLTVSTVLSLVFVPAFFILIDDLSGFLGRKLGRFVGEKED
ncbi:efflux RND transporter permease subunit [Microvirga sp. W0021]|uniref:Efflux RND transporter permease subunit n=1 Tax=Hohaiivirga grylli TaxID=3133970 RepID=A0ABV0BFQ6_9HYPH